MSDGVEEQFLLEGIKRYAPALDTIHAFESMMKERLSTVAKAYTSNGFMATKEAGTSGTQESTGALWIWVAQPGTLQGKKSPVVLELGMAWKGYEVAYYCNLLDSDYQVLNFSYDRKHPRVQPRMWSKKARLFMLTPPNSPIDLDSEFKILLDELILAFK